jgi:bile acid:Na+ symporter, BASS family
MQQIILFAILFFMVFAVSLDLQTKDFKNVAKHPKAVVVGLIAQFLLLPLATLLATLWLRLPPAVEAAMLLVACCPGGALSNVVTHFARGNLALSLSISATANCLALFLTPLLFTWLINLNPETARWAVQINVSAKDLIVSLFLLLALPMSTAIVFKKYAPQVAQKIRKPLENIALVGLLFFIVGAVANQWANFAAELTRTLPVVIGHNALGLALGALAAALAKLNSSDKRAVVIEAGMQNSGLALGIVGTQFNSDLSMIAVAGLWGIWHIISGGSLALVWRQKHS